ncbi:hypothetical protein Pcinc_042893 [Petrolisthes cinctipes]|uniref:Uncharacterized protein n=1 Tax=Petrolisthes cinctipes TaxID=88211 RepID=A0AAE1BIN0_PETCI|nr:hypothetical protein Pcinc_042893 [Petrolisthes cinctipes]
MGVVGVLWQALAQPEHSWRGGTHCHLTTTTRGTAATVACLALLPLGTHPGLEGTPPTTGEACPGALGARGALTAGRHRGDPGTAGSGHSSDCGSLGPLLPSELQPLTPPVEARGLPACAPRVFPPTRVRPGTAEGVVCQPRQIRTRGGRARDSEGTRAARSVWVEPRGGEGGAAGAAAATTTWRHAHLPHPLPGVCPSLPPTSPYTPACLTPLPCLTHTPASPRPHHHPACHLQQYRCHLLHQGLS